MQATDDVVLQLRRGAYGGVHFALLEKFFGNNCYSARRMLDFNMRPT
ncbi:hypothetical protein MNBD_ALPHA05-2193 [hydrothermal vent metagenome]|uniref:Uncharacterized protein n=1 Tax=hydrothermal vent metagenome TaxID=652676 RepID=A0A3B0SBM7_9ZZZZ